MAINVVIYYSISYIILNFFFLSSYFFPFCMSICSDVFLFFCLSLSVNADNLILLNLINLFFKIACLVKFNTICIYRLSTFVKSYLSFFKILYSVKFHNIFFYTLYAFYIFYFISVYILSPFVFGG